METILKNIRGIFRRPTPEDNKQHVITLDFVAPRPETTENIQNYLIDQDSAIAILNNGDRIVHNAGQNVENALNFMVEHYDQDPVIIIWVSEDKPLRWRVELNTIRETFPDAQAIVCFPHDEDGQLSRSVQLSDAWAFASPFSPGVLIGYISAATRVARRYRILHEYSRQLTAVQTVPQMVESIIKFLRENVIFDRVTIALLDNRENIELPYNLADDSPKYRARHLLEHRVLRGKNRSVSRELLRPVAEDRLVSDVIKGQSVRIIPVEKLRRESPEKLSEMGWKDIHTTEDIKVWMCIPLVHVGEVIGIITLDDTTDANSHAGDLEVDRLLLEAFATEVASAIDKTLTRRNDLTVERIMRNISNIHDRDGVLQTVVKQIQETLECKQVDFYRRIEKSDWRLPRLRQWASSEQDNKKESPEFEEGEGIAGNALKDGKSRIIAYVSEPGSDYVTMPHGITEEMEDRTPLLVVPVKVENRTIGVINAYHEEPDFFTPYDLALVDTVATQVAALIERTWMLDLAYQTHLDINLLEIESNHLADTLRGILSHAMELTNSTAGVIYSIEKTIDASIQLQDRWVESIDDYVVRKNLTVREPENFSLSEPRFMSNDNKEINVTGKLLDDWIKWKKEIAENNETSSSTPPDNVTVQIFRADVDEERKYIKPELLNKKPVGVKTVIGALLLVRDQVHGVIYLNSTTKDFYTSVEQKSLQIFASQASIAIDKAQRIYRLHEYSEALNGLANASRKIIQPQGQHEVLSEIVRTLHEIVKGSFSYIVLRDEKLEVGIDELEFRATWPPYYLQELIDRVGRFNPIEGCKKPEFKGKKGVTGLAFENNRPYLVRDLEDEFRRKTKISEHYIGFEATSKSELAVPIRLDGENSVIGVINIERPEKYGITINHKRVVEYFAQQAAIVIERSRRSEESARKTRIIEGLYNASQEFLSLRDSDVILRKVVSLTREAAEADWVSVILFNDPEEIEDNEPVTPVHVETHGHYRHLKTDDVVRKNGISRFVIDTGDHYFIPDVGEDAKVNKILRDEGIKVALCLPFTVQGINIGVMWIHYKDKHRAPKTDNDSQITAFKTYANIAATHYAREFSWVNESIATDIRKDYKKMNDQANRLYFIAICSIISGIVIIGLGAALLFAGEIEGGTVTLIAGLIAEALPIIVFQQYREISTRQDKYHGEKLSVKQFENLLLACDKLPTEAAREECRSRIVQSVTANWFNANGQANSENTSRS